MGYKMVLVMQCAKYYILICLSIKTRFKRWVVSTHVWVKYGWTQMLVYFCFILKPNGWFILFF